MPQLQHGRSSDALPTLGDDPESSSRGSRAWNISCRAPARWMGESAARAGRAPAGARRQLIEVEGKYPGRRRPHPPALTEIAWSGALPDRAGLVHRSPCRRPGACRCHDPRILAVIPVAREHAQGAQLGQVFKGIDFVCGNQPGLLPRSKLAGPQMKNSQNVLTAISGHELSRQEPYTASEPSMRRAGTADKGVHALFMKNSWISRT